MKINKNLNHTTSHVLATAVLKLYPNTKIAFGPATEEGFYYDFDFEKPIVESDLIKIEKQMKKVISSGAKVMQVEEVKLKNPYKNELIDELKSKGQKITYYGLIDPSTKKSIFTDLCRGGHIENISNIKHFKLLSLAGAYWRGDSNNKQLLRIYGTAWETKEELKSYLDLLEDRKERDHRKIGKEMNIFMFHKNAGQGFPIWLENGMIIKNAIQQYIRQVEYKYGFREVETPAFGAKDLYIQSGHLAHYREDMFPPLEYKNESLIMRPMSCPHHTLIYSRKRRSYRELPIRMSEHARLYRYEASGGLSGLERVRSMMLIDAHIFARKDQIKSEFLNSYKLIEETLDKFKIEIDYISLSLHDKNDKDKYFDDEKMWNDSENQLREVLDELNIEYKEMVGEAAFYGPKVDIQVKTALGHEITLSTLQLDFLLPQKFDLSYVDQKEQKQGIILIHRGLLGTYERLISILLEQSKGNLPFWIAPHQVTIIPVLLTNHYEYTMKISQILKEAGLRVNIDDRDERIGKKIREAQIQKTKFQIVIGDNEVQNRTINVRAYGSDKQEIMKVEKFIQKVS